MASVSICGRYRVFRFIAAHKFSGDFLTSEKSLQGCHSCKFIHLPIKGHTFTNYELERKNYNLRPPKNFNFARDFIDQWARAEYNGLRSTVNPAFWLMDEKNKKEIKLSFQQLSSLSQKVANALTGGCSLKRQDKVIVILPKIPEWWIIFLACVRADLTICPGTTMLRAHDIKHRLKMSGAKCIITVPELVPYVDEAAENAELLKYKILVGNKNETRPGWTHYGTLVEKASNEFECADTRASDPMMLFFTSGTTGAPKMVEHSHGSYGLGHITTARYMLMINSSSVLWNLSDTGWAKSAWSSFFAPWIMGSCVFVHNVHKFDPLHISQVLTDYPVTHFCCSPTGLRIYLGQYSQTLKPKALRHCVGAGEPVNPELMELWKKVTGLNLHEGYGQTETTLVCCRNDYIPYKLGSMGKSSPDLVVGIINDEGKIVESCTEGNIAILTKPARPLGLFNQYLNDPVRTAASFLGDWYVTGDRGYLDEEDFVFFVGRGDDVINSAGYRIGPFEVESALLEHPAVLESAVVSSPDETRGEVVKAFVVVKPEYRHIHADKLTVDLQDLVKRTTAPYKYPRKIEFVTDLPKTVSGKIRRVELRNKEWQHLRE
ncbi:acyl-coenzyme A synthetase ACSM3 mitochondrial isoform X1 [Biomphalaria pfeifferi]|uniref:medium-chain acyl-CoA ligase n=1 Tax=Biomphalaria pfeifferi TaxID=112525 RepID=A0AAD8EZW7_BIOPF|nr:acyl-coenzyme A synthetase ACSM3 mitochondrial isoform X1 [Biomphalaria pfeifferi]